MFSLYLLKPYVANLQRLVLGAIIKSVVGKKQRRRAFLVNSWQRLECFVKVFHPMKVMEFKWQDSIRHLRGTMALNGRFRRGCVSRGVKMFVDGRKNDTVAAWRSL
jgi:hypothetical protein